ncbi:MAG: endonuclease [Proteobacteria bacterium]|nr:endonuclease [Pseudomonadota bacterium]
MQTNLFSGQSADLRTIRDRLRVAFGRDRSGVRVSAINQFIRSFISSRTMDWQSDRAFMRLLSRYRSPEALADAPVAEIEAALAGVQFADKKARELKAALLHIRARAGTVDLDFLAGLDVDTALLWLEQIRGVGRKIAAATLNFSVLRKRAFVVDTHIIRIMRRFGFVKPNAETEDVYDAVMAAARDMSADDLSEFHWHLKRLGQHTCKALKADCPICPLAETCLKRLETSYHSGHAA